MSMNVSDEQPLERRLEVKTTTHYCNNCAAQLYFPERGILQFDGRFCDQDCKNEWEFKRSTWLLSLNREARAEREIARLTEAIEWQRDHGGDGCPSEVAGLVLQGWSVSDSCSNVYGGTPLPPLAALNAKEIE